MAKFEYSDTILSVRVGFLEEHGTKFTFAKVNPMSNMIVPDPFTRMKQSKHSIGKCSLKINRAENTL